MRRLVLCLLGGGLSIGAPAALAGLQFPIHGPGGVICRYHKMTQLGPQIICTRGHYRVYFTREQVAVEKNGTDVFVGGLGRPRWSLGCELTYKKPWGSILFCGRWDQPTHHFHGLYGAFVKHWIYIMRPREGVSDKVVWKQHVR